MPLFNSSSRQKSTANADGSIPVYCSVCQEFIGNSMIRIARAVCVLCQAAEAGKVLDPEAVRQYRLSKGSRTDVSMLLMPDDPPGMLKKFSLRTMAGDVMQAIGLKQDKPVVARVSKQVAREKKATALFSTVDLEMSLTDADKALNKEKE